MRGTPRGRQSRRSFLSVHPRDPRSEHIMCGDVSSPWPPLATKTSWDDTSTPIQSLNHVGAGDRPFSSSTPCNPKLPTDVPAPIQTPINSGVDVSSPVPRRNPNSWDETSQPQPAASNFGAGDVPSPASHALATQSFLGRDVPAPIQTLNDFGGGDASSPSV
jgi:hypothetical protein